QPPSALPSRVQLMVSWLGPAGLSPVFCTPTPAPMGLPSRGTRLGCAAALPAATILATTMLATTMLVVAMLVAAGPSAARRRLCKVMGALLWMDARFDPWVAAVAGKVHAAPPFTVAGPAA